MSTTIDPGLKREQVTEVADDHTSVRISKVLSRCGARLEIDSRRTGATVRLDSLELESLSWQNRDTFRTLVESNGLGEEMETTPTFPEMTADTQAKAIRISNEFASVEVQKLVSGPNEVLRIISPKLDYEIVLAPLELEALTLEDTDLFSEFLINPFGPEAEQGGH